MKYIMTTAIKSRLKDSSNISSENMRLPDEYKVTMPPRSLSTKQTPQKEQENDVEQTGMQTEQLPSFSSMGSKSRKVAKEAISSRWESRAQKSSFRTKQMTPETASTSSPQIKTGNQFWQSVLKLATQAASPSARLEGSMNGRQKVRNRRSSFNPVLKKKDKERTQQQQPLATVPNSSSSNEELNGGVNHVTLRHTSTLPTIHIKGGSTQKTLHNQEQLANTLANIKITSILQSQLETISKGHSSQYLKSVLSILPAEFDETSAWISSIQTRKRAFVLLDLARVIREHAQFLSETCGFEGMVLSAGGRPLPPTHKLRRRGAGLNSIRSNSTNKKKNAIVYIQPQFRVTKNPNIELLKLFVRLGVDLRCSSSDDVLAASQALIEERKDRNDRYGAMETNTNLPGIGDEDMVLVDDVANVRKPDGFFRHLLKARRISHSSPCARTCQLLEVAVDGVDEVERISETVRRFSSRAGSIANPQRCPGGSDSDISERCRFILRLPSTVDDEQFKKLVLAVHAAALKEDGDLAGISVDLSKWSFGLRDGKEQSHTNQILTGICDRLRLFRLLMLSIGQFHIRIDFTGLPNPFEAVDIQTLKHALTRKVSCDVVEEEITYMINQVITNKNTTCSSENSASELTEKANNPATCSLIYTADISTQLVARAGALCTRIIGKKSQKPSDDDDECKDNSQDGKGAATKLHYYIDDGCYGSLGSSTTCASAHQSCTSSKNKPLETTEHLPVPLYGTMMKMKKKEKKMPSVEKLDPSTLVKATVWGPTCDGLDKVCEAVELPHDLVANRDWLVFPNLGCGGFGGGLGLGTAFNGFDPPDVAYCILGYFSSRTKLRVG